MKTFEISPFGLIRNVFRFDIFAPSWSMTEPYSVETFASESESSLNCRFSFAQKSLCEFALSTLTPSTTAFAAKHLAFTFLQQRNNASAFASFAEAATLYEALGDTANQGYCETGRTAASLNDRLEVLHAAGRASTEQAERQNAARQMTPLFPELIACFRQIQAVQLAAESEFFAGSTFQLLGDFLQAVEHYRAAANDYGELKLDDQRREAYQRCEKLLT